jgi:hypothetical protein
MISEFNRQRFSYGGTILNIVGATIWHDFKWACDNFISSYENLLKNCMELSQTSGSLY